MYMYIYEYIAKFISTQRERKRDRNREFVVLTKDPALVSRSYNHPYSISSKPIPSSDL